MLLNLKLLLLEYYFRQKFDSAASVRISPDLEPDFSALSDEQSANYLSVVRTYLQRFPQWFRGHLRLGWIALRFRDFQTAQISFEAVRILSKTLSLPNVAIVNAAVGLSRCYLSQNVYPLAIQTMEAVGEIADDSNYFLEQLCACYALAGRNLEALQILKRIDVNELSAQAVEILRVLQDKNSQP